MPRKKPTSASTRKVELRMSSPPELWRLSFTRDDAASTTEIDDAPPLLFSLGLSRFAANSLGVELTVEIKDFAPLHVLATYRCVFVVEVEGEPGDIDRELRTVAAQIGPNALYPFLREAIASTVAKAGLPPLVPPVVNFRSVFSLQEVTLPPVPDSQSEGVHGE
jgi:preprotein translocase subunit SecB